MREIWLVFRREYLERVATRTFLLGTLLFPILIGGMMILPSLFDGGEIRSIVIVDETTAGVGDALAARLARDPAAIEEGANEYRVTVVTGTASEQLSDLNARVESGAIDGYLVVPGDVFAANVLRYRSTNVASPGMMAEIQAAASETVRGERLRLAGIDPATITEVIRPVIVDNGRIGGGGEDRGDAVSTFIVVYLLAFVIYFMVFLYGVHVMRSVLEEKTSRIAEVLVSSLGATHLMAGKILGVAGAALTQVAIWAAVIGVLVLRSDQIAERLGVDPEMLAAIEIEPLTLLLLLAFFFLGFFLYASLFAALGASITTEQEAQSFQMMLILPLVAPLLFLVPLTTDPLGRASTVLGLFPLTSPVAMPMRLAAASVPPGQVALSLVLLAVALAVMSWLAGRIYRIGILSTGKRPSLRELARWLRMA